MELFTGRPDMEQGRLPKETRCYDLLDSLDISYTRVDHEAAMTMEACGEIDKVLGTVMCKNLLLCNRQKTDFYLLMLPGEKHFKTSTFSKTMGTSRLSFAEGTYMEAFLDITPGSLSVLGLMNDRENRVQLVMDADLLQNTTFGCHPCVNTSSLGLTFSDLLEKFLPAVHHTPRIVTLEDTE